MRVGVHPNKRDLGLCSNHHMIVDEEHGRKQERNRHINVIEPFAQLCGLTRQLENASVERSVRGRG